MDKKDFFISYYHEDKGWAEWIAWQLEEARYRVLIQKWDMGPGSNFVHEMQRAAAQCERTLLLVEQNLDSWGFQHKTFQEYLCAESIVHDQDNLDNVVDHLGEDHWRVVDEHLTLVLVVSARGFGGMEAAVKPTGTYLRRPLLGTAQT